jgi:hypothetical protein
MDQANDVPQVGRIDTSLHDAGGNGLPSEMIP